MRIKVEEESPFFKILANILILCVFTFIGYTFYQDHVKLVAAEHWIPIQATIKDENVYISEAEGGGRGGRIPRKDCLMGSITYAFESSSYEKRFLIDCKESDSKESDFQVEQQLHQTYPVNSKIGIRFNPQKPEQAITAAEFKALSDNSIGNLLKDLLKIYGFAILFFIGLFVVLFVVCGVLFGRWKKPPSNLDYDV